MSQITTHILDTSRGRPAAGVDITLSQKQKGAWRELARGLTNDDGRVTEWSGDNPVADLPRGEYKLAFATAPYFAAQGVETFYPYVEVVFQIQSGHYHVPLLLNPFGYSTYRGS